MKHTWQYEYNRDSVKVTCLIFHQNIWYCINITLEYEAEYDKNSSPDSGFARRKNQLINEIIRDLKLNINKYSATVYRS